MAACPPCCKLNLVLSRACTAAVQIDGNIDPVHTRGTETVHHLGYLSAITSACASPKPINSTWVLIELVQLIYILSYFTQCRDIVQLFERL